VGERKSQHLNWVYVFSVYYTLLPSAVCLLCILAQVKGHKSDDLVLWDQITGNFIACWQVADSVVRNLIKDFYHDSDCLDWWSVLIKAIVALVQVLNLQVPLLILE
jgi:hypothetical protein